MHGLTALQETYQLALATVAAAGMQLGMTKYRVRCDLDKALEAVTESPEPLPPAEGLAILTPRQRRIYLFIMDYAARHGSPPTVREVQRTLGMSSPSVAKYNLDVLVDAGLLQKTGRYRSRSYAISKE